MHDTDTQAALRLRRLSPGPGGAAGRTFKVPVPRRDRDTGIILFKFRVNFNLKDKPVTSLFQDLPAAAPVSSKRHPRTASETRTPQPP